MASLNDKHYSSTSAQEQRERRLQRRRERERVQKGRGLPVCEHAARDGGSRPLHLHPVDTICFKLNKTVLQNDRDRHNILPLLTMKSQR